MELRSIVVVLLFAYCHSIALIGQERNEFETPSTKENIGVESKAWDALFVRRQGWFGGDGIFGIPLDGKEYVTATDTTLTLFTFGDTMIGNHDGKSIEKEDFTMINNSIGLLQGRHPKSDTILFHYKINDNNRAESLFVPKTQHSNKSVYYWLGDGFVNIEGDGNLHLFAYPIQHIDTTGIGGFGFEQIGVNLLTIPLKNGVPDFDKTEQIELPFFNAEKQTSFGSAIYVSTVSAGAPNPDGNIYVYAVSTQNKRKGLLVARVTSLNFLDFDKWRFWNGSTWVPDLKDAKLIAWDVSNEMSVSPLPNGKIALVYQYLTLSNEVSIQVGESLAGPFSERKTVYTVSKEKWGESYFPYNAKAYPHLSTSDSILISYNVNSFDFFNDILNDPNLYRPRFINVAVRDVE
jgi:hypothetical protein